jgi:hypothetical protein
MWSTSNIKILERQTPVAVHIDTKRLFRALANPTGRKSDVTYVVDFSTVAGEPLAVSVP